MCSAAVFRPVLPGVNRTVKLVLPPGLTVAMRLVTVNIAKFTPSMVMPETVRLAEPLFVMVKMWLVLVPTTTEPKLLVAALLTRLVPAGC